MSVVVGQLDESRHAIRDILRSRPLRRLNLALVGSVIGDWAYAVAFSVYVYRDGGATALGVLSVVRWVTMAALSPFVATLADRFDRRLVMIGADVVRVALVLAAAMLVLGDGPALAVYVLSILIGLVGLAFRPAQLAILPSLATTPAQLSAANVVSSTINSVGFFVGPAIAGLMLAFADVGTVFVFNAMTFVWSAAMVVGIRGADVATDGHADESESAESGSSVLADVTEGYRAIFTNRDLRLIVGLYVAQTVVAGSSVVYEVAIALDLLGLPDSGVGILNAALGIGGLIGGLIALVLSQRGRLARDFGTGVALWAAPLLIVVAVPTLPSALIAMTLIGVGNSLVDVNAETILQRLVPDEVLGRVFGALDGAAIAGMALGAGLMPLFIATVGLQSGLAIVGVSVTALVFVCTRGLARIDRTALAPEGLDTVLSVPMFSVLPERVVERLARTSSQVTLPAGRTVFEQGDEGDLFYIVESGEVEVSKVGQPVARLGEGGSFGEIALLRDVPRTATVVAITDVVARTIERRHFLAAVVGHVDAEAQAELVVGRRLDTY